MSGGGGGPPQMSCNTEHTVVSQHTNVPPVHCTSTSETPGAGTEAEQGQKHVDALTFIFTESISVYSCFVCFLYEIQF